MAEINTETLMAGLIVSVASLDAGIAICEANCSNGLKHEPMKHYLEFLDKVGATTTGETDSLSETMLEYFKELFPDLSILDADTIEG